MTEQKLRSWMAESGVSYELLEHPAADSALALAQARGTPPEIGGKSLLFKLKRGFVMAVVPGDARIDGKRLRKLLGVQRYRFASRDELMVVTGLKPGCVPPVGPPIFDVELVADAGWLSREEVAFSLATPTRSARMAAADYLTMANPRVADLVL